MSETSRTVTDIVEITQVVVQERQIRDREWWDQLQRFYHPEARIHTSWFDGSVAEYVERSKTMVVKEPAGHRLGQPVVRANGSRAVADTPLSIEFRGGLRGVEVDVTAYVRLLHRLERRDEQWRILACDVVYERDTVTPTVPGTTLNVQPEEVARFRPSYRMLSLWLTERGYSVGDDLYGLDRPEAVDVLYREAFEWAGLPAM